MSKMFLQALDWHQGATILYLLSVHSVTLILFLRGFLELLRYCSIDRGQELGGAREHSSLLPEIAVLMPAYNEEATIVDSVRAMLKLRYPRFEVIVINDGSRDATLEILIREFHLYRSARYYETPIPSKAIRGVYESMDPIRLIVIDKDNGAGKADALNAGINISRCSLVCVGDADSLLEPNALIRMVHPFVANPGTEVLAVGGTVRPINDCQVSKGSVTEQGLARSWIAILQTVEYLRAFLIGRMAWSSINCLTVISGAFGLFSRSALLSVNGYTAGSLGEDMDLVVRLHCWARKRRKKYKILTLPDPVCWTQVPERLSDLKTQRVRWQRGGMETIWAQRHILGNPRYGLFGLFAMPYFVLFELLTPLVQMSGYVNLAATLLLGEVNRNLAAGFLGVSVLYGTALSVLAVLFERLTLRRYPDIRHLRTLLLACVVEHLGFRNLVDLWQAEAFWDVMRGKPASWGHLKRKGFRQGETAAEPAPPVAGASCSESSVA